MTETGIYPAITASIGGRQRRLTLERQWRRAIESGDIDRSTSVHYEAGPGAGTMIEAGKCAELTSLFDEIKGPLPEPEPEPAIEPPAPETLEPLADRMARIEAEVNASSANLAAASLGAPRVNKPSAIAPARHVTMPAAGRTAERSGPSWAMQALAQYAKFDGRACRSEYWYFQLFVTVPLFFLLGIAAAMESDMLIGIWALAWLGLLVPGLAVSVRRLHDRDLSGWILALVVLLSLIPVLGTLAGIGYIVLMALPGTVGPNDHGPAPEG